MTDWLLCVYWLVCTSPGDRNCPLLSKMEPFKTRAEDRNGRSSRPKPPTWFRSLSLNRRRPEPKNAFVLPKLPCYSVTHGFIHQHEDSEDYNNDGSQQRIFLPPLHSRAEVADVRWNLSPDKQASWLLPTVHRKEVYRQAREQRQLSAKVGRLPPLQTATTPPPGSSVPAHSLSLSAPPPRSPRGKIFCILLFL